MLEVNVVRQFRSHLRRLINETLQCYPRNQEELLQAVDRAGNALLQILEPLAPSQAQIKDQAVLTSEDVIPY